MRQHTIVRSRSPYVPAPRTPKKLDVVNDAGVDLGRQLMAHREQMPTDHLVNDIPSRVQRSNPGEVIMAKVVNQNNGKGDQIHVVTDNAEIHVFNMKGKWITVLIARPKQMTRYGEQVPEKSMGHALNNELTGKCEL